MKFFNVLLVLLVSCLLAACSRQSRLTVINNSATTLTNVVASGSGFSESLGPLAPGAQQDVVVRSQGESGLRLSFQADGKNHTTPDQGYFENGYKVSATVAPDFSISVEATLR